MRRAQTTPIFKHSSTTRTYGVDFGRELPSGTTLSGSPSATATPDGLTISAVAIISSMFTDVDDTTTIAANEGVSMLIAGGASGDKYELTTVCGTSDSGEQIAMTTRVTIV